MQQQQQQHKTDSVNDSIVLKKVEKPNKINKKNNDEYELQIT